MLVSPAEPAVLRKLGQTSSTPEKHGADFLMFSRALGMVGVQRKEINDLVASLNDDRLAREIPMLQRLDIAVVLIEGRIEWTTDGLLSSTSSPFTRAQYLGTLWSMALSGLWTCFTSSTMETTDWLSTFNRWLQKDKHTSLLTRRQQAPRNEYGLRDRRAQHIHILEGFPGVGYQRAMAIVDFFGGLPLEWTGRLNDVPGVGATTARRMERMLGGERESERESDESGGNDGRDGRRQGEGSRMSVLRPPDKVG